MEIGVVNATCQTTPEKGLQLFQQFRDAGSAAIGMRKLFPARVIKSDRNPA